MAPTLEWEAITGALQFHRSRLIDDLDSFAHAVAYAVHYGLGLSIVKRIVEKPDGKVGV